MAEAKMTQESKSQQQRPCTQTKQRVLYFYFDKCEARVSRFIVIFFLFPKKILVTSNFHDGNSMCVLTHNKIVISAKPFQPMPFKVFLTWSSFYAILSELGPKGHKYQRRKCGTKIWG